MANELVILAKDVEGFFEKVFKAAPSETASALAVVNQIAPEAEIVFTLVDPAAAAIADPIITEVQADLGTVATFLKNGATASVPAFLAAIKANLNSLLAAGHISNPASVTKATGLVSAIESMIESVLSTLPAPAAPAAVA